jgi:N-acetylneuraminic acid mutarotase
LNILLVGGYCGDIRECLDSVEKYDPASNKWKIVASMKRRRSGASVNVFDGKIYVAGGHDGPLIHNSVECYDPETNSWSLITEMNTSRRNAGEYFFYLLFINVTQLI